MPLRTNHISTNTVLKIGSVNSITISGRQGVQISGVNQLFENFHTRVNPQNCHAKLEKSTSILKTNMKNIYIKNGEEINNEIQSNMGKINIGNNCKIRNTTNNMGSIQLGSKCIVTGVIKNNMGSIDIMDKCHIDGSVTNNMGKTHISESKIHGNVNTNIGKLWLDNTEVTGALSTHSEKNEINNSTLNKIISYSKSSTLGENNKIKKLELKDDINSSKTIRNITGSNITIINGVIKVDGKVLESSSNEQKSKIKYVSLKNNTTLDELTFTSEKCILTLEGNAKYNGNPNVEGLIIQQA